MKCLATWRLMEQALEDGNPVMLLYVLDTKGSSPGKQGFCMAVVYEGTVSPVSMAGSIGGGILEHQFVELAKEKLHEPDNSIPLRNQRHNKLTANEQTGIIFAEEQTVFLYPVQQKDRGTIRRIIDSIENNRNGRLTLSPAGISFSDTVPVKDYEFVMQSDNNWKYTEKTGFKNRLYIIGGGHCALALSKLMRSMDFYIRIYDDRSELKSMLENDAAHEKHVVKDYTELAGLIDSGPDHYVVIMTMSHETDDIALRALTGKQFRYIGILGSRTRMQKLMNEYRSIGISNDWLGQIHTPVGLQIRSQSPEEIAVSIAAEMIQVKNEFPATVLPAPAGMNT